MNGKMYVASESYTLIRSFIAVNSVNPGDCVPIGAWSASTDLPFNSVIWVIGEIGRSLAYTLDQAKRLCSAQIRYAEPDERVFDGLD